MVMTVFSMLNHPNAASGMLIQMALWLLGMPLPKARYPEVTAGIRVVGMKMLSMGFDPWLWVFGP